MRLRVSIGRRTFLPQYLPQRGSTSLNAFPGDDHLSLCLHGLLPVGEYKLMASYSDMLNYPNVYWFENSPDFESGTILHITEGATIENVNISFDQCVIYDPLEVQSKFAKLSKRRPHMDEEAMVKIQGSRTGAIQLVESVILWLSIKLRTTLSANKLTEEE